MKSSIVMSAALLAWAMASAIPAAAAPSSESAPKAQSAIGIPRSVLPFQDDYAKAVAEARARKVPLFIEAWAPW